MWSIGLTVIAKYFILNLEVVHEVGTRQTLTFICLQLKVRVHKNCQVHDASSFTAAVEIEPSGYV